MATLTKLYSINEAAQHNSKDDCWLAIHDKVYDVPSYLDQHPGRDDVFLAATGKDAREEFEDAGQLHSKNARERMEKFFVGELDTFTPHLSEEEITGNNKSNTDGLTEKWKNQQHCLVPVAVAGISVLITFLYLRRRK